MGTLAIGIFYENKCDNEHHEGPQWQVTPYSGSRPSALIDI